MAESSSNQSARMLKKGSLLFSEGEKSRAMYLIKSGSIRLYMKKGSSNIEIDTVRAGSILGELAFLDGNPRSLSGEALTDCEVVEISGPMFLEVIAKAPEWLRILLKTVVGRLRATNTRLRLLEATNTSIDYSDKKDGGGGGRTFYQYLSWSDFIKICSAFLICAKDATKDPEGPHSTLDKLNAYSIYGFGIPVSKVECVIDILERMLLVKRVELSNVMRVYLKDAQFIEQLIAYLVETGKVEEAKRAVVSLRGHYLMKLIVKSLIEQKADPKTGIIVLDVNHVQKLAPITRNPEDAFKIGDFNELGRLGFVSGPSLDPASATIISFKPDEFILKTRLMEAVLGVSELNEQKRKLALKPK